MDKSELVIGQVVSTDLYNWGNGVVYAIHGEQSPSSVRDLHGVVSTGGSADFDIVFYNGTTTKRLPECILWGIQWKIHDEIVSQNEIDSLLENAKCCELQKQEEKEKQKKLHQEAVEKTINNSDYAHLNRVSDKYAYKEAVKNIRLDLKKHFPKVRFSVRMSRESVYVTWKEESNIKKETVGNIILKFQTGYFNPYEDLKKNEYSPFNEVFGGVDYIFFEIE
ncbi:LPD29 domain-containing protein [Xenorhabdus sp. SGI246]|uniref:LPD29 domain-containing protein n=1 Tax=Xenorhabdus sp. SGI246 TaxID=3158263 RepID=UPI00349F52F1